MNRTGVILHQNLVLRGEPVTCETDLYREKVTFKWRDAVHTISSHAIEITRDPEGLLLEVAKALVLKAGNGQAFISDKITWKEDRKKGVRRIRFLPINRLSGGI